MSGGGASHGGAATDMVEHLKHSHSLILLGKDAESTPANWEATTNLSTDNDYADNPSVLRYILEKGITDAGGNPFDGVSSYDPEEDLTVMQTELDDFITSVGNLDPDGDVVGWLGQADSSAAGDLDTLDVDSAISSIISQARLNASQVVADAIAAAGTVSYEQVIERARTGFEIRAKRDHLAGVAQFTGPMADATAVNTSAFIIGMAQLQRGYDDRLAIWESEFVVPLNREGVSAFIEAFRSVAQAHLATKAQVHLQEEQLKNQYILEATRLMTDQNRMRVASEGQLVEYQRQVSSANIVAYNDQYQQDLDIDVKGQNWDLELFQQGANVMSAISGSVVPTAAKPSRASSTMSGALGGAATGALIGSKVGGGWGALIGGGIGLIGGGAAGYFE